MRIRRVRVAAHSTTRHDEGTTHTMSTRATDMAVRRVSSIGPIRLGLLAVGAACCASLATVSASDSSTGAFVSPSNATLLSSDSESLVSQLPVSVPAAIGIVCGVIVAVCLCLALCARSQMRITRTSKKRGGAGAAGAASTAAVLQAKIEAARRGGRPADGGGSGVNSSSMVFTGGARSSASHWLVQLHVMSVLSGGGLDGLGACRYAHFGADDFVDEPWATASIIESLRVSGCILDVVLAARQSMPFSALSGLVPLGVLVAMPFHSMLLEELKITDWYGPIEGVELERCITIAVAALAVHVLAIVMAYRVYKYDRAPSVAADKEEAHAKRMQAEAQQMAAILPAAGGASAAASPSAPAPFTMHTYMRSPTHPPSTKTGAAGTASLLPSVSGTGTTSASGLATRPDPSAVPGRDPSVWPLAIFCACALLSYAPLGFQAYNSFDESLGRRFDVTATPRLAWPPSAGRGPFITFLLCLIVGTVAIVPIAFSLKLLALLLPRDVHPHLLRKAE